MESNQQTDQIRALLTVRLAQHGVSRGVTVMAEPNGSHYITMRVRDAAIELPHSQIRVAVSLWMSALLTGIAVYATRPPSGSLPSQTIAGACVVVSCLIMGLAIYTSTRPAVRCDVTLHLYLQRDYDISEINLFAQRVGALWRTKS